MARAEGYYGESLKHPIASFQEFLADAKAWLDRLNHWTGTYPVLAGLAAAAVAFLVSLNPGIAAGVFTVVSAVGVMAVEAVRNQLEDTIHDVQGSIATMQTVYNEGGSLWYVQGIWNGQETKYSTSDGGTDFIIGVGHDVPFDVLHQVGYDMWQQCQDAPTWQDSGSSPGLNNPTDNPV